MTVELLVYGIGIVLAVLLCVMHVYWRNRREQLEYDLTKAQRRNEKLIDLTSDILAELMVHRQYTEIPELKVEKRLIEYREELANPKRFPTPKFPGNYTDKETLERL